MVQLNKVKVLICPGVQKSGTTYLYELLQQYPEIKFSRRKEMHFFTRKINEEKLYNKFLKHFKNKKEGDILADFTPEYLPKFETIKKIHKTFKNNVKFIIILRNPVNRAYSHFLMKYTKGKERRSFQECIESEINDSTSYLTYLGRGKYYNQLKNLEKYYNKESFHIMIFEKLINEPEKYIDEILKFMQIKTKVKLITKVKINKRETKKVSILGKIFFAIPLRYRSKFRFITKKWKGTLFNKNMDTSKIEFSDLLKVKMKEFYKEDINNLKKYYKLDLKKWEI